MRSTTFSILKALAIILVVLAHAAAPTYLSRFAYMVGVPAFFVLSGFFFRWDNLERPSEFIVRRIKRLYIPFIKWGIVLLLLHNWFFQIGFLSEIHGNAEGGVTHPYGLIESIQHLWSMAFNMSGYDPFLAGAFWFFRSLLLANIAFLLLLKASRKFSFLKSPILQTTSVVALAFLLALWQAGMGLHITGVAQGGYRELMGIVLIGIGLLLRQLKDSPQTEFGKNSIVMFAVSLIVLLVLVFVYPVSMAAKPASMLSVLLLALAGTASFVCLRATAQLIEKYSSKYSKHLQFIGENTLSILLFHLIAFKLVSMIKVSVYGLDWEMIGGHPVVQHEVGDYFWILYAIVGVYIPLIPIAVWKVVNGEHEFNLLNPKDWLRILVRIGVMTYRGFKATLRGLYNFIINLGKNIKFIVIKIWETTSPKEN